MNEKLDLNKINLRKCDSCNIQKKVYGTYLVFETKIFKWLCSECDNEIRRLIKMNETYEKPMKLLRMNKGKTRFSLLDFDFIEQMAFIMMFGIVKGYPENNWKNKVENMGDIDDSMLRHCIADCKGEWLDKDSGLPHVAHLAVNAMFKYYQVNRYGTNGTNK